MKVNFYLDEGNIIAEVNHSTVIKQKRFGLDIQVSEKFWDNENKRVKNDKRITYADSTNKLLDKFKGVVRNYYSRCIDDDIAVNKDDLIDYVNENYFGGNKKLKNSFIKYIDTYISTQENRIPKVADSTIEGYRSFQRKILEYCVYSKTLTLDFHQIDDAFLDSLMRFYLYGERKNARKRKATNFEKWVLTIKRILKQAQKDGLIKKSSIRDFEIDATTTPKTALTDDELQKLFNAEFEATKRNGKIRGFTKRTLDIARDAYLMYSYLSIRYSDGQRLQKDKHFFEEDGAYYLNLMPEKTIRHGKRATIRIGKKIIDLLNKYNFRLPKIGNTYFNEAIRECCKQAGINENVYYTDNVNMQNVEKVQPKYELITVHTSRATFITLCKKHEIPDTAICKMVGINLETLKHYDKTTAFDYAKKHENNPFFN